MESIESRPDTLATSERVIVADKTSHKGARRAVWVSAFVLLYLPCMAFAQQWIFRPSVDLETQYSDNFDLTTESERKAEAEETGSQVDKNALFQTRLSLEGQLERRTETTQVNGRLLLDYNRYDSDDLDRDDEWNQLFSSFGQLRTKRSRFRLALDFRRDTTSTSRQLDVTPDAAADSTDDLDFDPDQGLLREVDLRRIRYSIRPGWNYNLSRRNVLNLRYQFRRLEYDEDFDDLGVIAPNEYKQNSVSAGLTHSLTDLETLRFTGDYLIYNPSTGGDTDNFTATAEYEREFSPTLSAGIRGGWRWTDFKADDSQFDETDNGPVYGLFVHAKTRRGDYYAILDRRMRPTTRGLVETDRLFASMSYELGRKLRFVLDGEYFQTNPEQFIGSGATGRDYFYVEPTLVWDLTREWSLRGSYSYTWQEYDDADESAVDNSVYIGVNWSRPNPIN